MEGSRASRVRLSGEATFQAAGMARAKACGRLESATDDSPRGGWSAGGGREVLRAHAGCWGWRVGQKGPGAEGSSSPAPVGTLAGIPEPRSPPALGVWSPAWAEALCPECGSEPQGAELLALGLGLLESSGVVHLDPEVFSDPEPPSPWLCWHLT